MGLQSGRHTPGGRNYLQVLAIITPLADRKMRMGVQKRISAVSEGGAVVANSYGSENNWGVEMSAIHNLLEYLAPALYLLVGLVSYQLVKHAFASLPREQAVFLEKADRMQE
jgi:hypothetical protein